MRGTCDPANLLDLFENFVAYMERPGGLIKIVARSHQYLGVNAAIENLYRARAVHDDGSASSGIPKDRASLSMVLFSQKVLRHVRGNWTFVMVTDRNELDDQIYKQFADAGA